MQFNFLNQPSAPVAELLLHPQDVGAAQATREQEAMARQNGFQSYEQMLAWARQRNTPTGGTVGQNDPSVRGRVPQSWGELKNYLTSLLPSTLLGRTNDAYAQANRDAGQ